MTSSGTTTVKPVSADTQTVDAATTGTTADPWAPLAAPPSEALPSSAAAARILTVAGRLFYSEGIRAVSADRVIAAARVSKVTFYRHFRTKDDLVVAYLRAVCMSERMGIDQLRSAHQGDPLAVLTGYADVIADRCAQAGFRGCPLINAVAEYADQDHPVWQTVAAHRRWLIGATAEVLTTAGATDPEQAALELVLLRDGAMVAGCAGIAGAGAALRRAWRAVLVGHDVTTVR